MSEKYKSVDERFDKEFPQFLGFPEAFQANEPNRLKVKSYLHSELEAYHKKVLEVLEKEYLKAKNIEFKAGVTHAKKKIEEIEV